MKAPEFGFIETDSAGDQYKFMGGDPGDASRWQPVTNSDRVLGAVKEFGQGLTFNLADEAGIGIGAGFAKLGSMLGDGPSASYGDIYADMMAEYNREQDQFREANPGTALTANILGGLMTGGAGASRVAASQAAKGLNRADTARNLAKQSIGLGAAGGGVAGAGGSSGSVQDRVESGLAGAALGGGLGLAAAGVLPAARAVGRMVKPRSRADALIRENIPAGTTVGPNQTLAEAGGAAGEDLAQGLVTLPGRSRQIAMDVLEPRQAEQAGRVRNLLSDIGRKPPDEYLDDLDGLFRERGSQAAQDYGEIYAKSTVNNQDPFLRNLLDKQPGQVQRAWKNAQERAAIDPDRAPLPELFEEAADGSVTLVREPDLQAWHHIQQGLRDVSEEGATMLPTGRMQMTGRGRDYHKLQSRLRDKLYEQSPEFKTANQTYANYSEQIDAAKVGRSFMNKKPDEIARYVEGLPKDAQESYTMGMVRGMQDLADAAGETQDAARRVIRSSKVQQTIKKVLGKEDGERLIKGLKDESEMSRAKQRILGGSQTAQRQMAQEGLTLKGSIPVLSNISNVADRTISQPMRDVLGETLLMQGPAAQAALGAAHAGRPVTSNAFLGLLGGLGGGNLSNQ